MNPVRAGRAAAVLAGAAAALALVSGAGQGSAVAAAAARAATPQTAWGTTTSAPAGASGELFGVAAASPADVLAAGGYNPGQPPTALLTKPYAEHWNGTGWSATSVPLGTVYPAGQAAQLNGVADVAAGDGWAVGTVSDPSSLASQTLAYHWDGAAWTRSPTPDPAGAALTNELSAVAARAANDVWAAGGDNYPEVSLVAHWNGSVWRQVRVPNAGPLDAVTVAHGNVWAAGGDQVDQFNGSTWAKLPPPPVASQGYVTITGLADTAAGLWAVGSVGFSCGEGSVCTASYAALWNGTAWTETPAAGTGLSGVAAAGSKVLATSPAGVLRLTPTSATPQVTPALNPLQLNAIAADPAGNPWAAGWTTAQGKVTPAIINAPGIGQGGITVATGASAATLTWTGPATGAGTTDSSGHFAVGGLPDGSYTVIASLPGCQPGTATAQVTAGFATPVNAHITCPP
ncbi:MAG TPA: carboxypeptidase-like regulatory domain-containing protein [Streptosporangiaceae bacterium]|nr:carboxypeptidase-like regulatory domain-containing protein [Streptosporangiaceae bacterium]